MLRKIHRKKQTTQQVKNVVLYVKYHLLCFDVITIADCVLLYAAMSARRRE